MIYGYQLIRFQLMSSRASSSADSLTGGEEARNSPLLATRGLSKAFSGVPALIDVDFELYAGRVHALLGQNGAGKSTLISILSGAIPSDRGTIQLSGKEIIFANPREALDAGIVAVYQELSLLPDMTVAENLFLGMEPTKLALLNRGEMAGRTKEILNKLGTDSIDPESKVGELTLTSQQFVEIAKALIRDAKVLILDEPSAILGDDELELLYTLIRHLKETGIAVVYITHRLDEVMQIADDVTIMRDGKRVLTQKREALSGEDIIQALVGREVLLNAPSIWQDGDHQVQRTELSPSLIVSKLLLPGMFSGGISFQLLPGEILGLVGLTGSGRSRVLRALAGLQPPISGEVTLYEKRVRMHTPRNSISGGIVLVPEDRKRLGLILDQTIGANITLSILRRISKFFIVPFSEVSDIAKNMCYRLQVKSTGTHQIVRYLSGGNQQKIVIGRCLATKPKLLLLDEPLRGVDVGAKSEIISIIGEIAKSGTSVIAVSSEVEDILALTDRLYVMRNGEFAAELVGSEANEAAILRASVGYIK
jgi:ribose transport system ATP-binding protein